MRKRSSQAIRGIAIVVLALACAQREPLTAAKAEQIIKSRQFAREPVYAEVPQRVWWNDGNPRDDYDVKALRTLQNLQRAGLLVVSESHSADGTTAFTGRVTPKGFPILGTAPSLRGPCFRAMICYKRYDGLRNFVRHPTDPTKAHAELIWHYEDPTPLYPLFETKLNKPLREPFATFIAFYYKDYDWRFDVTVKKAEAD